MEAEQKRKAVIRSAIIRGGFKFIKLILLKENLRRISAVETLTPYLTEDEATGKRAFRYVPGSDKVYFEFDEMEGVFTAEVLDTERNRKWLASMATSRMFEIADENIRREINKQSRAVTKTIIKENPVVEPPVDLPVEGEPEDVSIPEEGAAPEGDEVGSDTDPAAPVVGVDPEPVVKAPIVPNKTVVKKQSKKGIVEFED